MNGPPTLHTKSMDPLSYMQINRWTPYTTCKSINGPLSYIQINRWTPKATYKSIDGSPKLKPNQLMDPLHHIDKSTAGSLSSSTPCCVSRNCHSPLFMPKQLNEQWSFHKLTFLTWVKIWYKWVQLHSGMKGFEIKSHSKWHKMGTAQMVPVSCKA